MGIQFACLDEGQREAVACLVEAALAALRPSGPELPRVGGC
jgi:hypothetical protein